MSRVKILKNSNLVNDDTESFTTGSSVTLHFVEVRLSDHRLNS